MRRPICLALLSAVLLALALPGEALAEDAAGGAAQPPSHDQPEIVSQSWTFTPPFGTFDNAQLQRGFRVYKEVCSNCHSMRLLSYRNLGEPGGPEFSPKAVEVLAGQVQVSDGPNEKGEMFQRFGLVFFIDTGMSEGVGDSDGAVLHITNNGKEAIAVCPNGKQTTIWDARSNADVGRAAACGR